MDARVACSAPRPRQGPAADTHVPAAGIATKLGIHSFRATGITAFLKNGGTLEKAAQMANAASSEVSSACLSGVHPGAHRGATDGYDLLIYYLLLWS